MQRFTRGACPDRLREHGTAIGEEFAARRVEDPSSQFSWRRGLREAALAALKADTEDHCSYCDGTPVDAHGLEEVDHFQPKSRFPRLVCEWTNLYFSCTRCNHAKREQWNAALLRPDAPDFAFSKYFLFKADSGELEPNPKAAEEDQHRAQVTIDILDLNRSGLCKLRRQWMLSDEVDRPYRFLRDAVGPSP